MSKYTNDILKEFWHATARAPRSFPGAHIYGAGLEVLGASEIFGMLAKDGLPPKPVPKPVTKPATAPRGSTISAPPPAPGFVSAPIVAPPPPTVAPNRTPTPVSTGPTAPPSAPTPPPGVPGNAYMNKAGTFWVDDQGNTYDAKTGASISKTPPPAPAAPPVAPPAAAAPPAAPPADMSQTLPPGVSPGTPGAGARPSGGGGDDGGDFDTDTGQSAAVQRFRETGISPFDEEDQGAAPAEEEQATAPDQAYDQGDQGDSGYPQDDSMTVDADQQEQVNGMDKDEFHDAFYGEMTLDEAADIVLGWQPGEGGSESEILDDPADPARTLASRHMGAAHLQESTYPRGGASAGQEGGSMQPFEQIQVFGADKLRLKKALRRRGY